MTTTEQYKVPELKVGPELASAELLGNKVLVKQWDVEEKTLSGIIIPDVAKEKPKRGSVVKVAPGCAEEPMYLREGMSVIFGKYAGTEVILDGEEYIFLSQHDVFMYFKPATK
jgi:chaperonin GroES